MTAIVVSPTLEKSLVWRRGIVTVPEEMATVSCSCPHSCQGLSMRELPLTARGLELELNRMGELMIQRLGVRGYEWMGEMRLHGPFTSYDFNERLVDVEAEAWRRAEREEDLSHALPFIIEPDATRPYRDYVLHANFLLQNVLTEVIVKEAHGD